MTQQKGSRAAYTLEYAQEAVRLVKGGRTKERKRSHVSFIFCHLSDDLSKNQFLPVFGWMNTAEISFSRQPKSNANPLFLAATTLEKIHATHSF